MNTKFWLENLKGRKFLGKIHSDGRIILNSLLKKMGWKCVDWIHLVCGRIAELL